VLHRDESVARGVRIANLTQMAYVMRTTIAQALSASSGRAYVTPIAPPDVDVKSAGGTDLAYEYSRKAISDSRQLIISLMAELLDSQLTVQSATNTIAQFVDEADTFGQRDHSVKTLPSTVPLATLGPLPLPAPKVVRTIQAPELPPPPPGSETQVNDDTGPAPHTAPGTPPRDTGEEEQTPSVLDPPAHEKGHTEPGSQPAIDVPHGDPLADRARTQSQGAHTGTHRSSSGPHPHTSHPPRPTGSRSSSGKNTPHPITLRLKNGRRALVRYR